MAEYLPKRPDDRRGFKIGIICALSLEAEMVEMVFDKRWNGIRYGKALNNSNSYTTGVIGGHNIVLAYCPGMGNISAAQTASGLMSSFTDIKIALVVGICGAVPFYVSREKLQEIVLGDCCISTAVIQFGLGRKGPNGFVKKDGLDGLGRMNTQIRTLMARLQTSMNTRELTNNLLKHLQTLQQTDSEQTKYPGADEDRLYKSSYVHNHHTLGEACEKCNVNLGICEKNCKDLGCEDRELEHRKKLDREVTPSIHFGYFGSSDTVLKSGEDRDSLAKTDKIIAFEMEGAGIWEICPTIVIKAACDYADSHKNKKWQTYAAAVAAAGLKAFLQELELYDEVESSKGIQQSPTNQQYIIPFLENQRFVGREDKLAELEQRLLSIDKETRQLAIFGLGGVGKTQLALAFFYAVKRRYPEYSIFWVSALSTARFKQDCIKIAKECSLSIGTKEDDVITLVQEYLNSGQAGKWLLVVDNADDKEALFGDNDGGIVDKLPHNEAGLTIFTTRYRDIAVDLTDGYLLDLAEMSMAEAELFLTRSLKRYDLVPNIEVLREILEALAFLPLAIAQAASYMIKTSMNVFKYLALMKDTEEEMVRLLSRHFRDNTRDKESPNAIAVTWLVSFQRIKEEEPMAADLLFFLAFLENKAIPLSILPPTGSDGDLTHAVGTLLGYSFLTRRGDQEIYDMHRLVHRAVKIWMQKEGIIDDWTSNTVSHLAKVFPSSSDWEDRNTWREYTPHAIRVLQDIEQVTTKDQAELCRRLARSLRRDGRIQEAFGFISKCVSWATQSLPEDDAYRLWCQVELARIHKSNGHVKEAAEVLENVVEIEARVLDEDDPDRLASQHELARIYTSLGQTKQAIQILKKVTAADARLLAEDHPERLTSEFALAKAHLDYGQKKQAIEILQKVVEIRAKILAEDHPDRLRSQHELARAYTSVGKTEQAIEMLEMVTAVDERVFAEDHPERLMTQYMLGQARLDNGQTKQAIEILEKVVSIRAKVVAEDHPDQLESQKVLAEAYESDGQLDQAILVMQHVVLQQRVSSIYYPPYRIDAEAELLRMLDQKEKDAQAGEEQQQQQQP